MADFSNIDVEKLVVASEEDLCNVSGGGGGGGEITTKKDTRHRALFLRFYSYLDLPFSSLLVRHSVLQKHFFVLSKVLSSSSS